MAAYLGSRVVRNEDARLLTGRALFVDDVRLPGMLHVAFLRSDHAHGRLRSVDVTAARARPGVVAVYTAADLGDYWQAGPLLVPPPPVPGMVFHACTQVPLAKDKVRHVGEPLAMVVAESRYLAEDALADIVVDLEPLPAVVDLEAALAPEAPRLHEHLDVESRRPRPPAQGRLRRRPRRRRCRHRPPLPLRPWRRGRDREPRRGGIVERAERRADDLGHDPGADSHQERPGPHARLVRVAGAGGSALRRRRVRPEDHDVLPRGDARAVGGAGAGPAGQVDRRPARELRRHDAGARPGARRRDGAHARRPHPGREGRLPARHRGLRPVRPDRADQLAVHAPRRLPRAGLRLRVHAPCSRPRRS